MLMSSDFYNDRQVWVINELSAVTLTSVRRFWTTSCLTENMTHVEDAAPLSEIYSTVDLKLPPRGLRVFFY